MRSSPARSTRLGALSGRLSLAPRACILKAVIERVVRIAASFEEADDLDLADNVAELAIPPANRLEALKGDLAGCYSVRVNDQFRVVFRFSDGKATDVRITDYH